MGIAMAAFVLAGCKGGPKESAFTVTGKPYEVLVVADGELWRSQAGDSLRAVLSEAVPMINSYEPRFDILRVSPDALKDIALRHRNIVTLSADSSAAKTSGTVARDVYARPQVVIALSGMDAAGLAEYIHHNRRVITDAIENAERERTAAELRARTDKALSVRVNSMFGLKMAIAEGFVERSRKGISFMWISEELPLTSRGIVIYVEDAGGTDFSDDPEVLVRLRNRSVRNIPGPSPGSHMTTGEYAEPLVEHTQVNGTETVRMSGFWDVEGDFMGGPFINYTILDTPNKRIINIDLYLYAPSGPKRNLLRSLDHLALESGVFGRK